MPDIEPKLIDTYQAVWSTSMGGGHFFFVYHDGTKHRTEPAFGIGADTFRVMIDILRNEKPVFADHITGTVMTSEEAAGESES